VTSGAGFQSIADLEDALLRQSYLPQRGLATAVFLSLAIEKPLLLEGEAGVGKTELAKALARASGARLIRLQCYEGPRRLTPSTSGTTPASCCTSAPRRRARSMSRAFGIDFLIRRRRWRRSPREPVVLLIDEIDRADDEFEAFLPRGPSDFQITIPEIGTIDAPAPDGHPHLQPHPRAHALQAPLPLHWISHPALEREVEILRLARAGVPERLAAEAAAFVAGLRHLDLAKAPGVAETIDWTQALVALGCEELDAAVVEQTLGAVLKYHEDFDLVRDDAVLALLGEARAAAAAATA
jgi:MoxR-like ATPase